MTLRNISTFASAAVLLELASLAFAHGGDDTKAADHTTAPDSSYDRIGSSSYFSLEEHRNAILAHIAIMTIAWGVVLPLAVMLSVARSRSRFRIVAQGLFLTLDGTGVILGVTYKHRTPDLYKNEKHGPIGWVSLWVASIWVIADLITKYANSNRTANGRQSDCIRTTTATSIISPFEDPSSSDRHHLLSNYRGDFESLHILSPSIDSADRLFRHDKSHEESDGGSNGEGVLRRDCFRASAIGRLLSRTFGKFSRCRGVIQAVRVTKTVLDRILLLFGFICIVTGVVVYGGIFRDHRVFNGLAHFIKGGVFFWYGFLTFGRWMGCFADFGWAWNKKPPKEVVGRWSAMMPSAEFMESAAICFYGATNVWLEHLSNPGGKWTANDLEHVSIALMFFAGGLLGMLVESSAIRDLSMTTIQLHKEERVRSTSLKGTLFEKPGEWCFSLNPVPALMLFLLGSMMSAHRQSSSVSTMLHSLWGQLLVGFSVARLATYAILYVKLPQSYLPQRPPTEIIASFCLMASGLMVMMSNSDTVEALESNSVDAMFLFNVTIGFTAFVMAWAAVCMALKGWAQRLEAKRQRAERL